MANGLSANQISNLAQQLREFAEEHDNASERARESAETTKRTALDRIPNQAPERFRDQLIDGLGRATTDQERCDAVDRIIKELNDRIDATLREHFFSEPPPPGAEPDHLEFYIAGQDGLRVGRRALREFRNDLEKIKSNEKARDRYRTIADILSTS